MLSATVIAFGMLNLCDIVHYSRVAPTSHLPQSSGFGDDMEPPCSSFFIVSFAFRVYSTVSGDINPRIGESDFSPLSVHPVYLVTTGHGM